MRWTLLFCVLCFTSALPSFQRHLDNLLEGKAPKDIPTQWFTQKLTHFNKQDTRTWKQRYFVNDEFYNHGLGGPIFVQIGGEGAISSAYVTQELMMGRYAQKFGALLVAVEHRFYGESAPLPDLSTANLQYLSSQEALEDLANFIVTMKEQWGMQNSPVVTFGGSYPGSLSAWFRLKYPHITIGSVASSAPVRAELDFYQYLDVVDESLSSVTGVNCDMRLQQASANLTTLLSNAAGQATVQKLFNVCKPFASQNDIANFVSTIMGNFMGIVQYDDEGGNPITIQTLCNIMNNQSYDPLTAYAMTSNLFLGGQCLDASYSDMMAQLENVAQPAQGVGARSWTYQTCAEFGFFQTTDSNAQPFGSAVPLSFYTQQCQQLFGMAGPDINGTNADYGSNHPVSATNILFVNGSIDPWHALSVTHDLTDSLKAILIIGTAHCANMMPPRPTDPPGLAIAQAQIANQINEWLMEVR